MIETIEGRLRHAKQKVQGRAIRMQDKAQKPLAAVATPVDAATAYIERVEREEQKLDEEAKRAQAAADGGKEAEFSDAEGPVPEAPLPPKAPKIAYNPLDTLRVIGERRMMQSSGWHMSRALDGYLAGDALFDSILYDPALKKTRLEMEGETDAALKAKARKRFIDENQPLNMAAEG